MVDSRFLHGGTEGCSDKKSYQVCLKLSSWEGGLSISCVLWRATCPSALNLPWPCGSERALFVLFITGKNCKHTAQLHLGHLEASLKTLIRWHNTVHSPATGEGRMQNGEKEHFWCPSFQKVWRHLHLETHTRMGSPRQAAPFWEASELTPSWFLFTTSEPTSQLVHFTTYHYVQALALSSSKATRVHASCLICLGIHCTCT